MLINMTVWIFGMQVRMQRRQR